MGKLTGSDIRRIRKAARVEVHELAPILNYNAQHLNRIEKGYIGKKKKKIVKVPDGLGPVIKRALILIQDERKKIIEEAEELNG